MELEKTNYMNTLFEFYDVLLTDKQQGYLSLYYGDDYSLGEIAEEFEVSRQAVYDNIKRTEKILIGYEEKLHLVENFLLRKEVYDQLKGYVAKTYPSDHDLHRMIKQLESFDE
ncbi:putative DNA-binding protein [Jeotgalibaca caeni]|uniref:putative DNA-binding protein n=1 Tax=Jeotgalibaca caeni TaxID=3028623 RepID=UPI00237D443B|nr:putative DNA-binding protein [Jeotgalibaca caeni]MDE1548037.1 putative DNA-binding protein [Jeotgalibaca caeni]